MWNPDADRDVPLRAIAGALVLGADHPVTAAEVHQVVETVETLRRAQSADAPDVTDAELEAAQAEADVAAGRAVVGAIPKAEAEAAATAARAEIDGMVRVRLTRLGSPSAIEMKADCDYRLSTDESARIPAGTVIEITLTRPGQAPVSSNLRVTQEDLTMLEELQALNQK